MARSCARCEQPAVVWRLEHDTMLGTLVKETPLCQDHYSAENEKAPMGLRILQPRKEK